MKIIIDTDEKYVLVEDDSGAKNFPTTDPAEILLIVAEELVPMPKKEVK